MITLEELSELVAYDRETGEFTSKVSRGKLRLGSKVGSIVHCSCKRYISMFVKGKRYYAHRAAWLLVYGEWPNGEVDHIDGNGLNNAIVNLRVVTRGENARNLKRPSTNTSGVVGVTFDKRSRKWVAKIEVNDVSMYIASCGTLEEAAKARKEAEHKFGFHENHGRVVEQLAGV